jgi:MFS family permease
MGLPRTEGPAAAVGVLGGTLRDVLLLFSSNRAVRLFGYGLLSVTLVVYLISLGFTESSAGLLLSLALLGDVILSLAITTSADRLGRRRMLLVGALLIVFAGAVLASTPLVWLFVVAALVGILSPSGYEVGPFLSIEQAALAQIVADRDRTQYFAWYNLVGAMAAAAGALLSGVLVQALQQAGLAPQASYRATLVVYAGLGVLLAVLYLCLSHAVEAAPTPRAAAGPRLGLHRSRGVVARLSGLFALDAFAGAFVLQSLVAYWFVVRFSAPPMAVGGIFFGANILAGVSGLVAARLAGRFGLINTMVFTHLPSNILLMCVPLMPTLSSASAVLLLRFALSQMDVPTRQSYTLAVVSPEERSAAAGVTTTARSVGAMLSPMLSGRLLAVPALIGAPFFISGGLKIVYDLLLYRSFRGVPWRRRLEHPSLKFREASLAAGQLRSPDKGRDYTGRRKKRGNAPSVAAGFSLRPPPTRPKARDYQEALRQSGGTDIDFERIEDEEPRRGAEMPLEETALGLLGLLGERVVDPQGAWTAHHERIGVVKDVFSIAVGVLEIDLGLPLGRPAEQAMARHQLGSVVALCPRQLDLTGEERGWKRVGQGAQGLLRVRAAQPGHALDARRQLLPQLALGVVFRDLIAGAIFQQEPVAQVTLVEGPLFEPPLELGRDLLPREIQGLSH